MIAFRRNEIWHSLKRRGVNENLRKVIATICQKIKNYVRMGNVTSGEFITKEELRQG